MKTRIINTCVILIMLLTPSLSFALSPSIGNVRSNMSKKEVKKLYSGENKGMKFTPDFIRTNIKANIERIKAR